MARRAFIELTDDPSPASNYDILVASGVTVADAAKLLSGLLFINLNNDEASLFLNPRAAMSHKLTKDHIQQIFDFMPPFATDDFAHDNY